ncbi:MAG: cyclic nucleotide-binding domain-containing protein [Rhodomicrobium sp.]
MLGSKIELLEDLPIFRGLSATQLGSIVGAGAKAFFEAGDNLITKDQLGNTAYLILSGTARCVHFPGTPAAGDKIEPGSLVGELAMLVDTVHTLTVQAKVRVRALALTREALKYTMERDPAIAQQIADNLLARLQTFARDVRRLDKLLANIEGSSIFGGGAHGRLTDGSARRISQLPFLLAQKSSKFG